MKTKIWILKQKKESGWEENEHARRNKCMFLEVDWIYNNAI